MTRGIVIATLLLAMTAGSVTAQGKGSVEIGYDVGVTVQIFEDFDETEVSIGLPGQALGGLQRYTLQTVRAGFFVSDKGQVETNVGFNYYTYSDRFVAHTGIGADYLHSLGNVEKTAVPYLKAGGAFRILGTDNSTHTQLGLKGAVGLRLMAATRFAVRIEGGVLRWLEGDTVVSHTNVFGNVGLSVFTK